jgi:hypothetical protein
MRRLLSKVPDASLNQPTISFSVHQMPTARVWITPTKPPIQSVQEVSVERYSELIEARMQRFLSATHLVIGSAESSRFHVLALGGYTYHWTHREWGQMLANWANQSRWLGVETWNSLDFMVVQMIDLLRTTMRGEAKLRHSGDP